MDPNRWFLDLWVGCPKQDFREPEMRFSRVRVCKFLDVLFLKRIEIYENLQVLLRIKNITQPNYSS